MTSMLQGCAEFIFGAPKDTDIITCEKDDLEFGLFVEGRGMVGHYTPESSGYAITYADTAVSVFQRMSGDYRHIRLETRGLDFGDEDPTLESHIFYLKRKDGAAGADAPLKSGYVIALHKRAELFDAELKCEATGGSFGIIALFDHLREENDMAPSRPEIDAGLFDRNFGEAN